MLRCSSLCDISYNGPDHQYGTGEVPPRPYRLGVLPGPAAGRGPPCSVSAGTQAATKLRAPQRNGEHRVLRRERRSKQTTVALKHLVQEVTDKKINLLS